ncbi:LysR family transcriptional regulator [Burkholderia cenocepacia]
MSATRFTPRQLAAFLTVADVRSFARAGERLNLSPSAVSLLIAELETGVGFRLFDRTTRSVALSPAGREFVAHAKSVMRNIELAQAAADDIRNRAAGIVRIAAPLVIATTMLPAAIKGYGQMHPKVVVRIRDAPVDNLVDMVANADVDLAIGPDQAVGDDVTRVGLFRSAWVLWCAPDNPLAKRTRITWADLRKQPLVAAGRDYERNVSLMRAGAADDDRVAPMDVVDNISTALGMAAAGLALTLAPAYVGLLARPLGLVMRRIVEPEVMRQVCLYHSSNRAVSPAAEGFRQHLMECLGGKDDLGMRPSARNRNDPISEVHSDSPSND